MADLVLCIVVLPHFSLRGLPTPGNLLLVPHIDQAALDQGLWAGEAKGAGWQLALKEGWGAQAGPGLQRAGRLWVWGKSLSKGPRARP